jgi:hypothetical protein
MFPSLARQRAALVFLVGPLLAVACAGGTPTPPPPSGIAGVTVVDVGCLVVPDAEPCATRRVPATITIRSSEPGRPSMRVDTTDTGEFNVALPPGRYELLPSARTGPLPQADPVGVDVPSDRFVALIIRFDSGVR